MAGHIGGRQVGLLLQDAQGRHAHGQNGRLGIGRQLQVLLGTVEAQSREIESESVVRLLEHLGGDLEIVSQLLPHSGVLRSLAGKNKTDHIRISTLHI